MADSTRDIRLLIRTEIDKALRDLDRMDKQLEETGKTSGKTASQFASMGKAVGAFISALAIREVAQFALETAKLAGEAEGLRRSLKNLAEKEGVNSVKLMKDLRAATADTVSDIELMRNATQAKFLGIDLKNLPVLFEFARRRAQDTGQSIDYLTQSIVIGLGRKSALILDNLGIQINDLNVEMERIAKTTGTWNGKLDDNIRALHFQEAAVNIAKKGIAESGDSVDNAATQLARMNAQWENFKVIIGDIVAGPTAKILGFFNSLLSQFATKDPVDRLKELNEQFEKVKNLYAEMVAEANKSITGKFTLATGGQTARDELIELAEEIKKVEAIIAATTVTPPAGKPGKPSAGGLSEEQIAESRRQQNELLEMEVELLRRRDELQAAYDELLQEHLDSREQAELDSTIAIIDAQLAAQEEANAIARAKLQEQINLYNQVAGIIGSAFVNLSLNLANSASTAGEAWSLFFRQLEAEIIRFLASKAVQGLITALGGAIFGPAFGALSGIGSIFGFQEGGFIKGSSQGRIVKVGENFTDELIIPLNKIGLPPLSSFGAPAMAGGGGGGITSRERITERSSEKILKVEVEGIFPSDREIRARMVNWNRNILRPDNKYVDKHLSTKKSEFE